VYTSVRKTETKIGDGVGGVEQEEADKNLFAWGSWKHRAACCPHSMQQVCANISRS